ncbi:hypothetical protein AB833_20495 [Chromatiales bacterium (ex Bugula neritina AB1)]|nr:hypothetical protein AB833_20495 [Chromatiales bacterium (ex Bugula neritina AB1)]
MTTPTVLVQLSQDLFFEKGKRTQMQCSQCACILHVSLKGDVVAEEVASELTIDPGEIRITNCNKGVQLLNINAKSINHGYTLASMLLEPDRISHSGNVFSFAYFVNQDNRIRQLTNARDIAETGSWELKSHASATHELEYPEAIALYENAHR